MSAATLPPLAKAARSSGWSVLGCALLSVAAGWLLTRVSLEMVGMAITACVALVLCFVFWRQAVVAIFLATLVEGFVRNYLDMPSVLLVKDAALAAVYVRVFGCRLLSGRSLVPAGPVNLPLAAFTAVVLLQCFNPNIAAPEEALVGIRTWLYYVPLFYVAQEMVQEERQAWRFALLVIASAVPVSALALFEYVVGPQAYASLGPAFARSTFVVVGTSSNLIYRPNATFDWPSPFALFLAVALFLCVGAFLATRGRPGAFLLLTLGLLVVTFLIENQRYLFVLVPLLVALMLIVARRVRLRTVVLGLAVLLVAGLVVAGELAQLALFDRAVGLIQNQDDVLGVRVETYWSHFVTALEASPIGLGAGATSIGARYALDTIPLFVEFTPAKVVGDLSIVGLVVYFWLFGALIVATAKLYALAQKRGLAKSGSLALAVLAVQLLVLYTGYDLAVAAVVFWFLSGTVLYLRRDQA